MPLEIAPLTTRDKLLLAQVLGLELGLGAALRITARNHGTRRTSWRSRCDLLCGLSPFVKAGCISIDGGFAS